MRNINEFYCKHSLYNHGNNHKSSSSLHTICILESLYTCIYKNIIVVAILSITSCTCEKVSADEDQNNDCDWVQTCHRVRYTLLYTQSHMHRWVAFKWISHAFLPSHLAFFSFFISLSAKVFAHIVCIAHGIITKFNSIASMEIVFANTHSSEHLLNKEEWWWVVWSEKPIRWNMCNVNESGTKCTTEHI